jgi:hypothetical protein
MARETLAVHGLKEMLKANAKADKETRLAVRHELRAVGDIVKQDAASLFAPVNSRSAAGYKTRVRQRGVAVEQSIRKTTGKHPEYGALQMRKALLPALHANAAETERRMERAMDTISRRYETGP